MGANPFLTDKTNRDALDIARFLKRDATVKVLEEYYSKKKILEISHDEGKKLGELKQIFSKKIDEMKTVYEKELKDLKEKVIDLQNKLDNQKKENQKEMKRLDSQIKNEIRREILDGEMRIQDSDLEFNIPLKKRNCFFVKNLKKAKELGGITDIKDLERVIDNEEFNDIEELKNTYDCLETVFHDWKNERIMIDDLDQEIDIKLDPEDFKLNPRDLIMIILKNHERDEFKDCEISSKIETDSIKKMKEMRDKNLDQIQELIVLEIIQNWKNNNKYNEDIKEFIKLIPITKSMIQQRKKNFEWKIIPKWNQRREKILDLLRVPTKSTQTKSKFNGLLIVNQ